MTEVALLVMQKWVFGGRVGMGRGHWRGVERWNGEVGRWVVKV